MKSMESRIEMEAQYDEDFVRDGRTMRQKVSINFLCRSCITVGYFTEGRREQAETIREEV